MRVIAVAAAIGPAGRAKAGVASMLRLHLAELLDQLQRGDRPIELAVEPRVPDVVLREHHPELSMLRIQQRVDVAVAEDHFATGSSERPLLMVVKINAHVAVREGSDCDGAQVGSMVRFGRPSIACGALHAALRGDRGLPFIADLEHCFAHGGRDRLRELRERYRDGDRHAPLTAAVCSALVQATLAVDDIRRHVPHGPTLFLVLPKRLSSLNIAG